MATSKIGRREKQVFSVVGGILVGLISLLCVLPMIMIISGSFSNEELVLLNGYSILPQGFSLDAYKALFRNANTILTTYKNTILITAIGTAFGLFITAMTAYVLQRSDFAWRNIFSYLFYFTTLFSGGLVPWYLLMTKLGMRNSLYSMILPNMLSVFNILVMRNFMKSIPDAISESARIDGANDFVIFVRLILPLSKASLATIGLFLALQYWNEWYNCMLFVQNQSKFSLQYYLYNMLNSSIMMKQLMSQGDSSMFSKMTLPNETVKLAMTVIATGPIVLAYPFVQRYFVKGITIGAVKG